MRNRRILGTLAVVLLGLLEGGPVFAQSLVITCINNATNRDLPYSFQWGNDGWNQAVVSAYGSRRHTYPYNEYGPNPPDLWVSFDTDPYTRGSQSKTYKLQRSIAYSDTCEAGTQYNFRDTNNNRLELYLGLPPRSGSTANNQSQAPWRYSVLCIENRTSFRIPYVVQWGHGEWATWWLPPGQFKWHSGPFRQGQTPPRMRIRFDYIPQQQGSQNKEYVLDGYSSSSQDCDAGKKFFFRGTNQSFDLFDPEKSGGSSYDEEEEDEEEEYEEEEIGVSAYPS